MALAAHNRGFRVVLWVSLPCTSESNWQHVKQAVSAADRDRLGSERQESIGMVVQLATAVRLVAEAGVELDLAFEWPRGAAGWKEPAVASMLREIGM
eukprot:3008316-Heterocapsa_arctica.AAC.1